MSKSMAIRCASHLRGKSGQDHDIELTDRKLAGIVRKCQCLPGAELFHYVEADGSVSRICSEDVNEYLREISAQDFTAKDFRTWVGTGQALLQLEFCEAGTPDRGAKSNQLSEGFTQDLVLYARGRDRAFALLE
jgi:DNA topoisomerase-1